jgi:hypothetical protein
MSAMLPRPHSDTLYAADEGMVAQLSSQECMIQNPRTHERSVMTLEVFQALDQCKEFATLDDHQKAIHGALADLRGQEEATRRVLAGLVERGLLQSAEQILGSYASTPARRLAPLGPIFILAEDRPEGLARCIDSLIKGGDADLDRLPIVVLDGSRSQAAREANRRVVDERRRDAGLRYLGNSERAAFIARLQGQMKAQAAALTWLLGEDEAPTRGQLFNWMLVLASGHRAVVFDDRQYLPQREMPGAAGGIDLVHSQQREAWFYTPDQPIPAQEANLADGRLGHVAGSYLGESLGRCISTPGRLHLAAEALRGAALPAMRAFDPRGRVAAIVEGSVGSLESPHNIWLYQLDRGSRDRFWASRESYLRLFEGDQVCHGVRRARAGLHSVYQPSAVDLSSLPGFAMPGAGTRVGPSFGVLTRFFDPESVVLHTTTAIGSQWQPPIKRSEAARKPFTPNSASFFTDHLQARAGECRASGAVDRANYLAALMDDLAASASDALQSELATYLTYKRADLVSELQRRLEAAGTQAPIYWEADLREIIQATSKELTRNGTARLGEWPDSLDAAGAAERLRTETRQLAAAVRAWPAAFELAPRFAEALIG